MMRPDHPADSAIWGILGSNALTLVMAVWQDWGMLGLMWPFWIQSVIIGWYSRQRILKLDRFSTENFKINDRAVDPTPATQRKVANFFAVHYGGFHAAYFAFLWIATLESIGDGTMPVRMEDTGETVMVQVGQLGLVDWLIFAGLAVSFWRSHRASHEEHVAADLARVPNIGTLMFLPYARIIPMHMTIVLGTMLGSGAVWLFALLKTGADLVMHKVEHGLLQSPARRRVVARPPMEGPHPGA